MAEKRPWRKLYMNVCYGPSRLSPSAQTTGGRLIQGVLRAAERSMCSRQSPAQATVRDANAGWDVSTTPTRVTAI